MDTQLGQDTGVDGGRQSLLLVGKSVGHFVGDMIGYGEVMGEAGDQKHPVDAKEIYEDRRIRDDHCRRGWIHEKGYSPRAASAKRRSRSPFMPSVLLSSRTRLREISSRRYASMARWAISLRSFAIPVLRLFGIFDIAKHAELTEELAPEIFLAQEFRGTPGE